MRAVGNCRDRAQLDDPAVGHHQRLPAFGNAFDDALPEGRHLGREIRGSAAGADRGRDGGEVQRPVAADRGGHPGKVGRRFVNLKTHRQRRFDCPRERTGDHQLERARCGADCGAPGRSRPE